MTDDKYEKYIGRQRTDKLRLDQVYFAMSTNYTKGDKNGGVLRILPASLNESVNISRQSIAPDSARFMRF